MKRKEDIKVQNVDSNNVVVGVATQATPGNCLPTLSSNSKRFVETTAYPFGTSDYRVNTDRSGKRLIAMRTLSGSSEITVDQEFHPTNYITPILVSSNIWYRNGNSISERHWEAQWTRESQVTDYTDDGTQTAISVTDASDYATPVTNRVSFSDFLGRTVCSVTPMGTTSNTYDGATSRLLATTSFTPSTSSTTTYLYDDLGSSVGTVRNGISDASETCYEAISNEIWRVTTQWRFADGETNRSSVVRSQMTGLSNSLRSHTVSVPVNGMPSVSTASFDSATKILTTTTQTGNATPTIRKSKYGILIETRTRSARTVYYHDAFLLPYHIWTYAPSGILLTRRLTERVTVATWQPTHLSTRLGISSFRIYEDATYDAYGQIQTQTDDLGNSTTNSYDAIGRLDGVSGATYPVNYGYDTIGRMTELRTTRDGSIFDETRWLFNHTTGLVTNKVYADNSTIAYVYTDDGKPKRTTWARGVWKENVYDFRDLLAKVSYSDDTPSVEYSYNFFGSVTNITDETGRNTAFLLNARQTVTNETVAVGTSSYTINRHVDECERPLMTELSVGGTNRWLTTYGYDEENSIRSIAFTNSAGRGFTVEYTNDCGYALGYKVNLPQGDVFTRTIQRDTYRRNLITSCGHAFNGTPLKSCTYSFDTLNRATRRIDSGTITNSFGYNTRSEVVSASISNTVANYAYDNIGNNLWTSINFATNTYTANALNQYSQISVPSVPSVENLTYDLDGNLLTNGLWSYSYDAENRLTAAFSNSVCVVSNAYDYMSRRVAKWTPSHTTTFVYDGWNLIQEIIDNQQFTITNQYVWGKDLSGTMQGAGGVGGLLGVSIDGSFYFPCYDNNGNVTAYVDESGSLVASYAYDAFGDTIAQSGIMADAFTFRFSTKYCDAETSLYYYGYRFYSPELHRWINRDPIEERGGLNLNCFCGNNPINKIDQIGLFASPLSADDELIGPGPGELAQGADTVYYYRKGGGDTVFAWPIAKVSVTVAVDASLTTSLKGNWNMSGNPFGSNPAVPKFVGAQMNLSVKILNQEKLDCACGTKDAKLGWHQLKYSPNLEAFIKPDNEQGSFYYQDGMDLSDTPGVVGRKPDNKNFVTTLHCRNNRRKLATFTWDVRWELSKKSANGVGKYKGTLSWFPYIINDTYPY